MIVTSRCKNIWTEASTKTRSFKSGRLSTSVNLKKERSNSKLSKSPLKIQKPSSRSKATWKTKTQWILMNFSSCQKNWFKQRSRETPTWSLTMMNSELVASFVHMQSIKLKEKVPTNDFIPYLFLKLLWCLSLKLFKMILEKVFFAYSPSYHSGQNMSYGGKFKSRLVLWRGTCIDCPFHSWGMRGPRWGVRKRRRRYD